MAATFHCDLPSLVSIETVVSEMKRRDGIAYQWKIGNRLIEGINAACEEGGIGYRLTGTGPMPTPVIEEEDKDRCIAISRAASCAASTSIQCTQCFSHSLTQSRTSRTR